MMPGKVNPVILEAAIQSGMKVEANDSLVTHACCRSSLQINEFLPLLAFSLLESLDLLVNMDSALTAYVDGMEANERVCRSYFERSPMIVTALLPRLGYQGAASLLREFVASGRENVREFLREKLGSEMVDSVFSPERLTALGYTDGRG